MGRLLQPIWKYTPEPKCDGGSKEKAAHHRRNKRDDYEAELDDFQRYPFPPPLNPTQSQNFSITRPKCPIGRKGVVITSRVIKI